MSSSLDCRADISLSSCSWVIFPLAACFFMSSISWRIFALFLFRFSTIFARPLVLMSVRCISLLRRFSSSILPPTFCSRSSQVFFSHCQYSSDVLCLAPVMLISSPRFNPHLALTVATASCRKSNFFRHSSLSVPKTL